MSIDHIEHVGKTDNIEEVTKHNPYHGKDGRFASKNGGGAGAAVSSGGATGGNSVGTKATVSMRSSTGHATSLANLSLHDGWGEKEIKNVIADCPRDGKKIASKLNAEEWISGNFKAMGAGTNEKGCTLSHTDVWGNKSLLTIKY